MREFEFLAELERRGLVAGIEHDAAQIEGLVVTQDALVEGVHFRFDLISWHELGHRAAAVNLSDLAASGAEPVALFVTSRGSESLDDAVALYEGIAEAGVPVRGGDTTWSETVVLNVTAIGRAERVPGRAGAQPGDLLVVTGPLGACGAAFREGRLSRPPLRLDEGRRLAQVAHAMLDISDGLAPDARHLAERSGCRLAIDLDAVPLAAGATRRRPRLRRGLRAARGDAGPARLPGHRPLRGGIERVEPRARRLGALPLATASKCARGRKPTIVPSGSPPANRITVGIERTS